VAATFWENPVTVEVPATSANLGPGYDTLGLALELVDEVSATVTGAGLVVQVEGEGAEGVPLDESHLIIRTMRQAFDAMDAQPSGLSLHCINRIPHARGLGSSSAAIVAGLWLARALVVDGDERLSNDDLLELATRIEGHPDNVAPCLLGGLTVAWTDADGVGRAISRTVSPEVRAVAFIPADGVETEVARGLLPAEIPHADAAFNVARAALLVDALTADMAVERRASLLLEATGDRLHQRQRSVAMPASFALVETLRQSGVPAFISGAGPTVLALVLDGIQEAAALSRAPGGFRALPLAVTPRGVTVIDG
jgi:homoserine kinase